MTVASVAAAQTKRLLKSSLSLFRRGFNPSKCKTAAKMAVARIKLLRNKRHVVVRQMRRDIALLLQSGQDATARIRVEHVIREQNVLAATEIVELFCELVVSRLSIITKQRECPADLKEGIASLIFAAPRCSEIPELTALRDIFEKNYGKDFVGAATDLRPSCGVNRMLVDKLSARTPSGEVKLKVMKEIAKEYQIDWDTSESEQELLKPPEEQIEGPRDFVSASSIPVKAAPTEAVRPQHPTDRSKSGIGGVSRHFEDTASAAEAAAESAKKAIEAAEAAAFLASQDNNLYSHHHPACQHLDHKARSQGSQNSERQYVSSQEMGPARIEMRKASRRHSYNAPPSNSYHDKFDESGSEKGFDAEEAPAYNSVETEKFYRRHSYNAPSVHSGIKFDESDCDEEIEADDASSPAPARVVSLPPERAPPGLPSSKVHHVHPKLPDYDSLASSFEALKSRKSWV